MNDVLQPVARPRQSVWVQTRPLPQARLRLFCLPFAGGSAGSFMPWLPLLAPDIQVCAIQLPGRGARFGEAPISDLDVLIGHLSEVIAEHGDLPYALFGHSLGGLLAYELSHRCVQLGLDLPRHLFVSASIAPRHRSGGPRYDLMTDTQLLARLRDYAGTPPEVLANQELMELLLLAIRADFTLLQRYRYRPRPRLDVPLTVLAGRDDTHVDAALLEDWQQETTGDCRLHGFEGGHFFLAQAQDEVLDLVRHRLAATRR